MPALEDRCPARVGGLRRVPPSARCTTLRCRRGPAANVSSSPLAAVAAQSSVRQSSTRSVGCSSRTMSCPPTLSGAILRSRRRRRGHGTPVFIHGDLQIVHVLDDGDEASGVGDWSEGGQGDAMYDLATLTLAHEEHLDDVMAGYGGHIEIDVIRAYWSLRSLMEIRWLVSTATARRRRSHRSRC
jgi:Phosphotransferase enzyme family